MINHTFSDFTQFALVEQAFVIELLFYSCSHLLPYWSSSFTRRATFTQAQQLDELSLAFRTYYLSLGGGAKVLNIIWVDA